SRGPRLLGTELTWLAGESSVEQALHLLQERAARRAVHARGGRGAGVRRGRARAGRVRGGRGRGRGDDRRADALVGRLLRREDLGVDVLDLRLDPELHRVAVAHHHRTLAEIEGHAAARPGIRRNHIDRAVLAGELALDREHAIGRLLDQDALDGPLFALRVLVLEAGRPELRPEGLAGARDLLIEPEPLAGWVRAEGEDVEEGAAAAAGERRVTD